MAFPSDKNVTRDVDGFIGVPTPTLDPHAVPLGYINDRFDTDRPIPEGTDLDTLTISGTWSVNTAALANTLKHLPNGPIPATAPNLAINPLTLATQPNCTSPNSATYWEIVFGATLGAGPYSPAGTKQVDVVRPKGTPLGGTGYQIASVWNMDGLGGTSCPARTISMNVTANTPNGFEWRSQGGQTGQSGWNVAGTGWQNLSWAVAANQPCVLEMRLPGGASFSTVYSTWITDIVSTPGPGTIRAGQAGLLRVTKTESRVMQEFYQLTNLGTQPTYRWALFTRLRSSNGVTWGPWQLKEPPIPTWSESQHINAVATLGASRESPLWIQRTEQRGVNIYGSFDGNTWWRNTGTGMSSPGWTDLPLAPPWANYSAGFGYGQYKRTAAGIVMLRGLVRSGNSGSTIATLPVGYRPAHQLCFIAVGSSNAWAHVYVLPDGRVRLNVHSPGAGTPADFISLTDVMFPCAEVAPNQAWTRLTPLNSFYDFAETAGNNGWPFMSYWVDEIGRYWLRGIAGRGSAPGAATPYAGLPAGAVTYKQIHLAGASNTGFSSQHYGSAAGNDSYLYWKPGSNGYVWFSLPSSPIIPTNIAPESAHLGLVPLLNGWVDYGISSFPGASLWEAPDGISHMRGLIKAGAGNIHNITASFGPTTAGTHLHAINASEGLGRVDTSYNAVAFVAGSNVWVSLDGITYLRES